MLTDVAIIAKHQKPEAAEFVRLLQDLYPQTRFRVEQHLASDVRRPGLEGAALVDSAQLLIVMGGDGTLIHAARVLDGRDIPILGVNLGSLGFMTEVPREAFFRIVDLALHDKLARQPRMKLSCRLVREGTVIHEDDVLNDVVINKSALARVVDHEIHAGTDFVGVFKADGIIVSTPTGSTAYAMSAGGPIVHPSVACIIMAPICPHALTERPVIFAAEETLRIVLRGDSSNIFLTLDGQAGVSLIPGDTIEVQRSTKTVTLLKNPEVGYFSILQQKLHWAER